MSFCDLSRASEDVLEAVVDDVDDDLYISSGSSDDRALWRNIMLRFPLLKSVLYCIADESLYFARATCSDTAVPAASLSSS